MRAKCTARVRSCRDLVAGGAHGDQTAAAATHRTGQFSGELNLLDTGSSSTAARVAARTIIIATGAEYRGLPIANIAAFHGAGVYYLATPVEDRRRRQLRRPGRGVSRRQDRRRDHARARRRPGGDDVALPRAPHRSNPAISVRTNCEVIALEGDTHLERIRCRSHGNTGEAADPIRHLFVMTGASRSTPTASSAPAPR
jgi:thioredoxin reductase (NADPH)